MELALESLVGWVEDLCRGVVPAAERAGVVCEVREGGGRNGEHLLVITARYEPGRRMLVGPQGRTATAIRRLTVLRARTLGIQHAVDVLVDAPSRVDKR